MATSNELRSRLSSSQQQLSIVEQKKNSANETLSAAMQTQSIAKANYDDAYKTFQEAKKSGTVAEQNAATEKLSQAQQTLKPFNEAVASAQFEYDNAQAELADLQQKVTSLQTGISEAETKEAAEVAAYAEKNQALSDAPTSTIKSPENTNPSKSDELSAKKMQNAEIVGADPTIQKFDDGSAIQTFDDGSTLVTTSDGGTYSTSAPADVSGGGFGRSISVPTGAVPTTTQSATVVVRDAQGGQSKKDLRVKIRVPNDYLVQLTRGSKEKGELFNLGGIIFPYTPQIQIEHKADYANSNPLHSNFNLYFYQRSSVSSITISGKFTVQNDIDAQVLLSTQHLLRALTKMRFGDETDSGAPPPICRLDAYGDFGLSNIPVAISSFRMDYPDSVDYYTLGRDQTSKFGVTSVPTSCVIALVLLPMYSREEMQKFTVSGWLSDTKVRKSGIL